MCVCVGGVGGGCGRRELQESKVWEREREGACIGNSHIHTGPSPNSYNIDWGDDSSEMGHSHKLAPVAVSKSYNSTAAALPQVEVSYCNSPILQTNKCCDTAVFNAA